MEMIKCPDCGAEIAAGSAFCQNCGAAIPQSAAPSQPASQPYAGGPQNAAPNTYTQPPYSAPGQPGAGQPPYTSGQPNYTQPPYSVPGQPGAGQPNYTQPPYSAPGQPYQAPYNAYGQQPPYAPYGQPGAPVPPVVPVPLGYQRKSKIAAGLLGIFLGFLGVHNFYLGYTAKALVQLLVTLCTCGIAGFAMWIWGLVEGIMILTGSINVDGKGIPLAE